MKRQACVIIFAIGPLSMFLLSIDIGIVLSMDDVTLATDSDVIGIDKASYSYRHGNVIKIVDLVGTGNWHVIKKWPSTTKDVIVKSLEVVGEMVKTEKNSSLSLDLARVRMLCRIEYYF